MLTRARSWMLGLSAALSISASSPRRAGAESLDPKRTWVVAAGVLEWADPNFHSFSKTHRKDQELFDVLGAGGVPAEQRKLLLDGRATSTAVLKSLAEVVSQVPEGGTLIFYFTGHGAKEANGQIVFATSDINSKELASTGLHVDQLTPAIAGHFKGKRVILMADCCYSGGLVSVAEALSKRGVAAVALTSSEASNTSTGSWSFTQTVIDSLRGRALADRDGDGHITLNELAMEVHDVMLNRELQRSGFGTYGVAGDLVLANAFAEPSPLPASGSGPGVRQWVLADARPARVLGVQGDRAMVEFYDYADATREWRPVASLKPNTRKSWPVGTALDVRWEGKVYAAKVLRVEDGLMYITYPGWASSWDEWVGADRVEGLTGAEASSASRARPSRRLKVEWQGKWYDAVVNAKKGDRTCIHYIGYDDSWDECVDADRVRPAD